MLYGLVGRMDEALRFIRRSQHWSRFLHAHRTRNRLRDARRGRAGVHELASERQTMNAADPEFYPTFARRSTCSPETRRGGARTACPSARCRIRLRATTGGGRRVRVRADSVRGATRARSFANPRPGLVEHSRPTGDLSRRSARLLRAAIAKALRRCSPVGRRFGAAMSHTPWEPATEQRPRSRSSARVRWAQRGALTELERLVAKGYHAGGWRGLVADRAYDVIREDPRFVALLDRLRSVADAERQRFLDVPISKVPTSTPWSIDQHQSTA